MSETQKQKVDEFIAKKKLIRKYGLLGGPGFLQEFAGDGGQDDDPGDDDDNDDDDDNNDDDPGNNDDDDDNDDDAIEYSKGTIDKIIASNKIDFAQLLKDNPEMKKQYQARFNKNMSKRLEKFADVDVDEYRDLKKRASEGKLEGDAKDWKDKYDTLKSEMKDTSKRSAIQSVGIESGLDAEQIAFVSSMIKLNKIEQDDEGEWMGIEDEIERIQEKFPRMFDVKGSDDDDDDKSDKKKSKYNPGKKKHNQDSKDTDPKERGRQRALERHKQKQK